MFRWFMDSLGMATSEVVFFLVFLLGFIVSIGGWLFGGGDHDTDHDGDHAEHGDHGAAHIELSSFFSIRALSLFITGFGAAGYVVLHVWQKLYLACTAGFLFGVALAAVGLYIIHFARKQEADSTITSAHVIGHEALVVTDIPGNLEGKGEISFVAGGVQQHSPAMTERGTGFRRGATVRIVQAGGSFVVVEGTAPKGAA
jgi:membrane protein implicated in regulation of membrane protease activity